NKRLQRFRPRDLRWVTGCGKLITVSGKGECPQLWKCREGGEDQQKAQKDPGGPCVTPVCRIIPCLKHHSNWPSFSSSSGNSVPGGPIHNSTKSPTFTVSAGSGYCFKTI